MHVAAVDQSGRIEETNHPTVVALSNSVQGSVHISATEKQRLINTLHKYKPRWSSTYIHVIVFSTLLFLLLKDRIDKIALVTIDPEYEGHEATIKGRVLMLCRKHGLQAFKDQLTFRQIGKTSPAHELAIKVFRGKQLPERKVSAEDVLFEFRQ